MSIYIIGDLHLPFGIDKPMDIFGANWEGYTEKIKEDWSKKVKPEDTVILAGDFSWATYLEETYKDFEFINNLPGRKILLKGNHDYWWTTIKRMKKFLEENKFSNIDFLYNNSYLIENKVFVGTRGWSFNDTENSEKKKKKKKKNEKKKRKKRKKKKEKKKKEQRKKQSKKKK